MKISSVEEMRSLDKKAMEHGIKDELLMENAAHACYFVLLREVGIAGKKFVVFAGPGNNGGDGLTLARKIHSMNGIVKIYLMAEPSKYKGVALMNYNIVKNIGIAIQKAVVNDELIEDIEKADVVIDAMLGTGISRNVEGLYKDVIDVINQHAKKVFSIDIPSGINGNNGKVMGAAIKADYTVTFGLPKIGNVFYPGYEHCGKLYVSHISFPPHIYKHIKMEINEPMPLPPRLKHGHKGSFGDVLFIAGASRYYGAPYFAAMSFLKAGGGYARLAAPSSIIPFLGAGGSELVFVPMKEKDGSMALKNEEELVEIAGKSDMLVVGCGLSINDETKELVRRIVEKVDKPVVIDGDGITAVAEEKSCLKKRKNATIITPHPGEMSRLTGKSISEILENRIEILRAATKELDSIIVLKGAHSLIGYPDGRIFVNMTGNSGMATAGSGDVLSGTIAAMHGIGFSIEEAARMGVFVHGLAGDIAAMKKGEDGITARDIMQSLPEAMKMLRENFDEVRRRYEIEVI
ncbi:MAG: NAD(P)H-hydrate dehydratase [Thermoplasmata archaeon]|nr:NAD(P)H-hydrate dehydratase [Thermoplasmata archaeon]